MTEQTQQTQNDGVLEALLIGVFVIFFCSFSILWAIVFCAIAFLVQTIIERTLFREIRLVYISLFFAIILLGYSALIEFENFSFLSDVWNAITTNVEQATYVVNETVSADAQTTTESVSGSIGSGLGVLFENLGIAAMTAIGTLLSYFVSFHSFPMLIGSVLSVFITYKFETFFHRFLNNRKIQNKEKIKEQRRDKEIRPYHEIVPLDGLKHQYVCGTTGTGKGANIMNIAEYHIQHNNYVCFIDGKGGNDAYDSIPLLKKICKKHERQYVVIDMQDYQTSTKYNPFKNMKDGAVIRDYLIEISEWTGNQQYYKNNAKRLWQAVANFLLEAIENNWIDAPCLSFELLIQYCNPTTFTTKIKQLKEDGIMEEAKADQYLDIIINSENGTESSVNDFAQTYEGIGKSIFSNNAEGIDMQDFIDNNFVLIVRLRPQQYPSLSKMLGKMMIYEMDRATDLKSNNYENLKRPGLFVYDELRTYFHEHIFDTLDKARNTNTKCLLTMLSPSDLEEEHVNKILNLCNEIIVLRVQDGRGPELLSKSIGTHSVWKETTQVEYNELLRTSTRAEKGTFKEVEELILHPNEIKELKDLYFYYICRSPFLKEYGKTEFVDIKGIENDQLNFIPQLQLPSSQTEQDIEVEEAYQTLLKQYRNLSLTFYEYNYLQLMYKDKFTKTIETYMKWKQTKDAQIKSDFDMLRKWNKPPVAKEKDNTFKKKIEDFKSESGSSV